MDFLGPFLAQRWYVVLIALLVFLWIATKIVKAVFRWGLLLLLVAGLWIYGASYRHRLVELGRQAGATVAAEAEDEALKVFRDEFRDARYTGGADGSFVISSRNLKLEGKSGAREARVTLAGHSFTVKMDAAWNALVEEVKRRQ